MNLANKITISRMVITLIIIVMFIFPFASAGIDWPNLFINETVVVSTKYFVIGVFFLIALLTDILDGYVARKNNIVTPLGKTLDKIADKLLLDSTLIILAAQGFIHPMIPVTIVARNYIVHAIRMAALRNGNTLISVRTSKAKNILLKLGIALTLFYNLPFELFNLRVSDILLIIATVLAVISCMQYFDDNKKKIIAK